MPDGFGLHDHQIAGRSLGIGTGHAIYIAHRAPGLTGQGQIATGLATAGSVTWSDWLYFLNGNTVANSGLWDSVGDAGLGDGGYSGTFNNSGTVAVEAGRLSVEAIQSQDYAVIQAIILFVAVTVGTGHLIVDVAYGWLDPRIRYG